MKLYLFGWAPSHGGSADIVQLMSLIQQIIDQITPKQILHIPYARFGATEKERDGDWFHRNIVLKGDVQYINAEYDDILTVQDPLVLISWWGKSARLLKKLREDERLLEIVNNAANIIGESAGAKVLGEYVRVQTDDWVEKVVPWIAIVKNTVIEPHYIEKARQKVLEEVMKTSKMPIGLGIDSSVGVMIDTKIFPSTYDVIGQGTVELKISKAI